MGTGGERSGRDEYTAVAECDQTIGRFHWSLADDSWEWDAAVFAIYGYEPGEIVPTTELVRSHEHPADLKEVRRVVRAAVENRRPWSCGHRIVDAHERQRTVMVAGDVQFGPDGQLAAWFGYMIDVTDARRLETRIDVENALAGVLEHRTAIDEAKGALMLAYRMDEAAAFGLLRSVSQRLNVKVHVLAREIVERMTDSCAAQAPTAVLDEILRDWAERAS